jgi:hypothetical protein
MLIVGFSRISVSGRHISCYHFPLILYMVLFSETTHMITIALLVNYIQNPKYSVLRMLRLIRMTVMGILLVVALIMSLGTRDFTSRSCPAQCLVGNRVHPHQDYFIVLKVIRAFVMLYFGILVLFGLRWSRHLARGTFQFTDSSDVNWALLLRTYVFGASVYLTFANRGLGDIGDQNVWGFSQVLAPLLLLLPVLQALEVYYGTFP